MGTEIINREEVKMQDFKTLQELRRLQRSIVLLMADRYEMKKQIRWIKWVLFATLISLHMRFFWSDYIIWKYLVRKLGL